MLEFAVLVFVVKDASVQDAHAVGKFIHVCAVPLHTCMCLLYGVDFLMFIIYVATATLLK